MIGGNRQSVGGAISRGALSYGDGASSIGEEADWAQLGGFLDEADAFSLGSDADKDHQSIITSPASSRRSPRLQKSPTTGREAAATTTDHHLGVFLTQRSSTIVNLFSRTFRRTEQEPGFLFHCSGCCSLFCVYFEEARG